MSSKRHVALARSEGLLPLPASASPSLDPFLDNVAHLLSGFGFRQIAGPPEGAHIADIYSGAHDLAQEPLPVAKWFYLGSGASRHELGIYIIGEESSLAYVHLLNAVYETLKDLGFAEAVIEIGSRGCGSCQGEYGEWLRAELSGTGRLCADCLRNLERQNLVAVWNCPNASCRGIFGAASQQMIDFLDESCRGMLMDTLEMIDTLEIPYILSPFFSGHSAREKILFEPVAEGISGRAVLGRGGDDSRAARGSDPALPILGFLTELRTLHGFLPEGRAAQTRPAEVFIVSLGRAAGPVALQLFRQLRTAGIDVAEGLLGNQGLRSQLRLAAERKSEIALIIGQKEALDETVILRDIRSGIQEVFVKDRIVEEVQKRLAH